MQKNPHHDRHPSQITYLFPEHSVGASGMHGLGWATGYGTRAFRKAPFLA
jgi:hypothetical protein